MQAFLGSNPVDSYNLTPGARVCLWFLLFKRSFPYHYNVLWECQSQLNGDCSKKDKPCRHCGTCPGWLFSKGEKKKVQIINATSESSLTFTSCWKSRIFIWQAPPPPPLPLLEMWNRPRTNSVKSPAWDLQHLSSFCPCHVILWSPLTRREGEKFDPLQKMGSFKFSPKSMKKRGLFVILIYSSKYISFTCEAFQAELYTIDTHVYICLSTGTLVAARFISPFSCNIFSQHCFYFLVCTPRYNVCLSSHSLLLL